VDDPDLENNQVFPVQFTNNPATDPAGAYFANLNDGNGPYPAVYVVSSVWQSAGGRIVVTNTLPVSGFYYTVYTHQGTSSQVIYDKEHNIVYSMVADPQIEGEALGSNVSMFS
jgi:hypothetical protein